MEQLQKIFWLQHIYYRTKGMQLFYNFTLGSLLLIPTGGYAFNTPGPWRALWYLTLVVELLLFTRVFVRNALVKRLFKPTADSINVPLAGYAIQQSSFAKKLQILRQVVPLAAEPQQWQLYNAAYDIIARTNNGDYVAMQLYYTVFEARLVRAAPNLLFDNKTAKGRQFKRLFLSSQRLQLEGGFNKVFDVYSPQYYQIDTLSFITPDVMEALLGIGNFDVEITNDRLLIVGPLLRHNELEPLIQKGQLLAAELNHNLSTYRDDRLDNVHSKQFVVPFGQALLKSPLPYLPGVIIMTVVLAVLIYAYTKTPFVELGFQVPLAIVVLTVSAYWQYLSVVSYNRRQLADFKKYHQL